MSVRGGVRVWLRLEGLLVLVAALAAYARLDAGWWSFAALFLAPDLSLLGYLAGADVGARAYNLSHSYAPAFACLAVGLLLPLSWLLAVGLIWCVHIGFDRALGYGLKYPEGFGFTHLGMVGRQASRPSEPRAE